MCESRVNLRPLYQVTGRGDTGHLSASFTRLLGLVQVPLCNLRVPARAANRNVARQTHLSGPCRKPQELFDREMREDAASRLRPPPAGEIPERRARAARCSPGMVSFQVKLRFVTPVAGGGIHPATPDEVDIVRVPSLRGHLRFWWRAIYAVSTPPGDLLSRERALWGGARAL